MKDRAKALVDLGSKLRAIRLEKGLSLEDVTEVTKIRTNFLEDIENGVLENFPGSIYVRGFIKSYLKVLEAEDLWTEYKPYLFSEEVVEAPDLVLGTCTPPAKGFRPASRLWMIIVLLMIIAGFGWYGFSVWTNRDETYNGAQTVVSSEEETIASVEEKISEPSDQKVDKISVEVVSPDEPEPSPDGEAQVAASYSVENKTAINVSGDHSGSEPDISAAPVDNATPVSVTEPEPVVHVLTISATKDCWVKLTGPEKTVFQGIIKGNTTREFEIIEKTEVVYGRPASVNISFAGEELGHPGKGGTVVHWLYSPDGSSDRIEN